MSYDAIPAEMRALRRWMYHRVEPNSKVPGGKPQKVPYQASGFHASSTEPRTWADFDSVVPVRAGFDGISYALGATDGLICVDIDGVRDAATGVMESWAQDVIDELDSYTEISPSGTGVHVWVRGTLPKNSHKAGSKVELYAHSKIMATTGQVEFGLGAETIRDRNLLPLFERCETGEFVTAAPVTLARTGCSAQRSGPDESAEDFRLLGQIMRRLRTKDAYKIEEEFERRFPDRYRRKGPRCGKTYIGYSIQRLLQRSR